MLQDVCAAAFCKGCSDMEWVSFALFQICDYFYSGSVKKAYFEFRALVLCLFRSQGHSAVSAFTGSDAWLMWRNETGREAVLKMRLCWLLHYGSSHSIWAGWLRATTDQRNLRCWKKEFLYCLLQKCDCMVLKALVLDHAVSPSDFKRLPFCPTSESGCKYLLLLPVKLSSPCLLLGGRKSQNDFVLPVLCRALLLWPLENWVGVCTLHYLSYHWGSLGLT